MSTKSIVIADASSSSVAKVSIAGARPATSARRSGVRSTTATIRAPEHAAQAGQCPLRATSPKPTIAPLNVIGTKTLPDPFFNGLERARDDPKRAGGLLGGENQRRVDPDARRVSHQDEPV